MVQYLVTTHGVKCMYMSYTNNPNLPFVRMQAVELVMRGKSVREAARHFGFAHNTVLNWLKRKPEHGYYGRMVIPTLSCRPKHHPDQLDRDVVNKILSLRSERNQCAEILHHRLKKEYGMDISLSSVKRTLKRHHCSKFSKWKKWHQYPARPLASKPGVLVEIDTVWHSRKDERLYVYTMLDVCSRWGFALPDTRITTHRSLSFLKNAQSSSPFRFLNIQSDHGPEFSKYFTKQILAKGFNHRHSRVRTPTDNGHLERFNRTLQEECLHKIPASLKSWKKEIPDFIYYYNNERPHMGINYQTPMQVVRSY